jgi:hypothetical protein
VHAASEPVGEPAAIGASSSSTDAAELGQLVFLGHPGQAAPWPVTGPQALRSERRDAHRRTRRAKPRRRPVAVAQSQLFGNR